MSKVTIGHDSCTTWTCGFQQGPSAFVEDQCGSFECIGLLTDHARTLSAPFLPVYWLYKGAKSVSKTIRSSR